MERKKKSKKIILSCILIFVAILIVMKIYSINIMLKVSDSIDNYNSRDNFAYTEKMQGEVSTTVIKRDNIFVIKENDSDEDIYCSWYDLESTNKYYNCCKYDMSNNSDGEMGIEYSKKDIESIEYLNIDMQYRPSGYANFRKQMTREDLDMMGKIMCFLTSSFVSSYEYDGIDCYTYKIQGVQSYIDKKTMLPIATTVTIDNIIEYQLSRTEYEIEYDENLLKEPDVNEFEISSFSDFSNENANYDEYSKKPISGTNLKPTENLIENVILKEDEKLDILPITENPFGVKSVEINNLKTYNLFREDYSNLRELTEEDFVYYSVTIAYKKGYELTFSEIQETNESYRKEYVFIEKESNNNNLVLIVTPRAQRDAVSIAISNQKIVFTSDEMLDIYYSVSKEIEKKLNFPEDSLFCSKDYIVKLDYETYKKLDYVKTPIKDYSEPVCWKIRTYVNVGSRDYLDVSTYINAITGDVIGANIEDND